MHFIQNLCSKTSWNLLRNLLRNPVELHLALHKNFPDSSPEPLRIPIEPDPEHFRNLVEPDPVPAPVHTGAILD